MAIAALLLPRTPQPLSYHHFADARSWLGIANFGGVASNVLFLVAAMGFGISVRQVQPGAIHGCARALAVFFHFSRTDDDGFRLGRWIANLRTDYETNRLEPAKAKALEALPRWR